MPIAFTICSNNYLAKARITAETFLDKHPAYGFFIFLVDKFIPAIDYENIANVKVIAISDIVSNIEDLAKKYNIIELNTAVKPFIFTFLFEQYKGEHVLYLDPDLMILDQFLEIEELFENENLNIVITPHFCSPIDDGKIPSEIHLSIYGLYNLGFIAIKHTKESQRFLDWWHDRLMKYCYIDPQNGMFTDQLWVNYAPIYFEGVYIFKHLGYNVAHWNLYEREIIRINGTYYVNGTEKLKFFHFSHYKFTEPYLISYKQNRHVIEDFEDLRVLIDEYQAKLIKNNHEVVSKIECYYQLMYEAHGLELQAKVNGGGFRNALRKVKNKTVRATLRLISYKQN